MNKNVMQIFNQFSELCPNPLFPFFLIFSQQCINILDTDMGTLQNGKVWRSWTYVSLQNFSNLSTLIFLTQLTIRATTLSIISVSRKLGSSNPSVLNKLMNALRISGLSTLLAVFAVSAIGRPDYPWPRITLDPLNFD